MEIDNKLMEEANYKHNFVNTMLIQDLNNKTIQMERDIDNLKIELNNNNYKLEVMYKMNLVMTIIFVLMIILGLKNG